MSLIDSILVPQKLLQAGFHKTKATILYAQLTGKASVIVNIPLTLSMALCTSLIPIIAECYILKKKEEIKNKLMQAKSGASVNAKLDKASKNADKALFKAEALAELNDGSYKNSDISDMSIFDELYEDNNAENVNKVELDKNEDSLNSNITENKEKIKQNTSNEAEDDGLDELRKQLGLI